VILPHEADVLGLQLGAIGGVREVYLVGFGRPWVFARSIIVNSGSIEEGSALLQLGNMPLGDLLFGDGSFQRSEIEVCRYHDACNASARSTYPLWARRSVFKREKTHVLVQEMFLPALWEEMS
jgi:chorismate--pyruvate lyase